MRGTLKLGETINEMGNALAAAEWPVKAKHIPGVGAKIYDTKLIYKDLVYQSIEMQNMESDLHDCVNELCLTCGSYHESYVGACDGCQWKTVKEGFR